MAPDIAWLTVPDFADRLGVTASHVREMIRDGALIAIRRGERNTVQLPAAYIIDEDGRAVVLRTLAGTLTLLKDAGFSDEAALAWLLENNDELEMSPLESLRAGHRSHVRRVAQALL